MNTQRIIKRSALGILNVTLLVSLIPPPSKATTGEAELKLGYIYLDETGFNKQQQSFNLYEGPALSLENLRYSFSNGANLTGDFKNLTMNNRHLKGRLYKSNQFGLNVSHNKYRRLYSNNPDRFTRRETSDVTFWAKPHRYLKFYGGLGQTDKSGEAVELFEPGKALNITPVDYQHQRYHIGLLANERGRTVQVEFRGSMFDNNSEAADQRSTERYRAITMFPVPRYEEVVLNGGFQHFKNTLDRDGLEFSSNSAWGGARVYFKNSITARYSFVFDRAQNSNELIATDNITHSFGLSKRFTKAGISAGYRKTVRDDIDTELDAAGVYLSGWAKVGSGFTLKGDFGSETTDVEQGSTLTGDKDLTRYRGSVNYRFRDVSAYAKFASRNIENTDIGSQSDYRRGTFGVSAIDSVYGQLDVSYVTATGDYQNTESNFEFIEHVISGDLLSSYYHQFQLGIGGVYYKSDRDVDVESISLRLRVNYELTKDWRLEGVFDGRNYDDLQNPNSYYTANIIEINIVKKFRAKED